MSHEITPFASIRGTNPSGNEFWSSRDFARVLVCADYRNFQFVMMSGYDCNLLQSVLKEAFEP
jgi:hypothetical protein